MAGQIEVSDGPIDQVGERILMPEAAGPILGEAIEPFGNVVGHAGANEGQHGILVAVEGMDELAQWFQAPEQCTFAPRRQKALRGPGCLRGPEVLEFVFRAPGAADPWVVLVERLEVVGIAPRWVQGMAV